MRERDLEEKMVLLRRMARVCDESGFDLFQKYAAEQFRACESAVFAENESDPALHLANAQYTRGQGHVWKGLMNMREGVEKEIANVRQQLKALRKEE
jgi:hypothetical protein